MNIKAFIATSLDGFIADKDGKIDFLHSIPNPTGNDMGYEEFMKDIDALIMGRTTFEVVCGFDGPWPYEKPVFVLSNRLNEIPENLKDKAELINGDLKEILASIAKRGYNAIYVDGGTTIQNFLKEELVDELTITVIPVLLGGGTPLFGSLNKPQRFKFVETKRYLDHVAQHRYEKY